MFNKLRKTTLLKNIINSKNLDFIMEAHNGISSKIVEETGFKAIWASGLTMSASMGLRDNNEASWCQILNNLEYMSDSTNIPILVDGDSGYGDFNNARRYVRKLEERGIAGVCFEDKLFPKTNSFINGENQDLADIGEFSSKILACKEYQRDPDFCVVARLESFITGKGLEDALQRADSYSRAGADAILVHSKKKDASDILNFTKYWTSDTPLIIVPTKYWQTPTQVFKDANISSIIWANHNMRSIIKTMKETSKNIYENESLINIENNIEPVDEIFRLQNANQLTKDEDAYKTILFSKSNKTNYYIPGKKNYSIITPSKLNTNEVNKIVKNDIHFENNIFAGKYSKRKYHTNSNLTELNRDFLSCSDFYNELKNYKIDFYTGVPDSLLKDYLSFIKNKNNVVMANEGLAVSMGVGYNLATGKIPCVYLQNSGLGNIINPLISLVNEKVYNIPMLFLIGWRGEPYKKDEPQHLTQGEITENMLNSINLKYSILPDNFEYASFKINELVNYIKKNNKPAAFLIKRQTFETFDKSIEKINKDSLLLRNEYINIITQKFKNYKFISTTGFTSRELYSIRKNNNQSNCNDFYTVGSMGHCSAIALGYSLYSNRPTVCLDGDGSLLMHMGSISNIGNNSPKNLIHILFNNNMHESVGGQLSHSEKTNFTKIAEACGYVRTFSVNSIEEFYDIFDYEELLEIGPIFIEIKIKEVKFENLKRPKESFIEMKNNFMNN